MTTDAPPTPLTDPVLLIFPQTDPDALKLLYAYMETTPIAPQYMKHEKWRAANLCEFCLFFCERSHLAPLAALAGRLGKRGVVQGWPVVNATVRAEQHADGTESTRVIQGTPYNIARVWSVMRDAGCLPAEWPHTPDEATYMLLVVTDPAAVGTVGVSKITFPVGNQ